MSLVINAPEERCVLCGAAERAKASVDHLDAALVTCLYLGLTVGEGKIIVVCGLHGTMLNTLGVGFVEDAEEKPS